MARGEGAEEQLATRDRAAIEHGARRIRVVAPIDGMVRSIGIADPGPLSVAEISIHILPAIVQDAAVGQQSRMTFKQRAVTNLMNVGSISVHGERDCT